MKIHQIAANLILLGSCLGSAVLAQVRTLQSEETAGTSFSQELDDLRLEPARRLKLENALQARDYKQSETILVEEAERQPKSAHAAQALVLAGGIFFLDGQYLNSVIAWKRAEGITPLDDRSRFTLAMACIKLNHRDWARMELAKLLTAQPQNALYLYWLARLDYDARNYETAIARLQKVTELDPKMTRAYDTLGLCFDYLGKFDEAIKNYDRAIDLNRLETKPSPWPHLDLAVSLISVNRLTEAEESLREALRYDMRLPQGHYQLGRVLEMRGELPPAIEELKRATDIAPSYPEPHLLLGRIYHRTGQGVQADAEIARYQELQKANEPNSTALPNQKGSIK